MAQTIDGTAIAAALVAGVADDAAKFNAETGTVPTLAVILVGNDPASEIYVKRKLNQTLKANMASREHRLTSEITQDDLLDLIAQLNVDPSVHGILVQLPLPAHIDAGAVLDAIDPLKDVDGFHPVNVGRLSTGTGGLVPCTPLGCMRLLETVIEDFRGLKAVVIGKSNIVGKPVALLLLERECTVEVTHIFTRGLPDIVRTADIVVVAAGSPGLVRGDWVKPGAVVIDVGINRIIDGDRTRVVGDAVFAELDHARAVTPVPGGVGPMTIACLLENTMRAAWKLQAEGRSAPQGSAKLLPPAKSVTVSVSNLLVEANIGLYAHEKGRLQRLNLHVTVKVLPPRRDQIDQTIDYNAVVAIANEVAATHTNLIETFAVKVAQRCLELDRVTEAEVAVEKPAALPNGVAATRVVMAATKDR